MTPPALSAPPLPAAPPTGAPPRVPELRARPPFSRPRAARPPLFEPRTLVVSLAIHVIAAAAVLLAPAREQAPRAPAPAAAAPESVAYLDVGAWGEMATDPGAALPPAAPEAAPQSIGAGAADSLLLRARPTAAGEVPFPGAVPRGLPRLPGGAAPAAGAPGGAGGAAGAAGGGRRSGPGGLGPELGDARLVVPPTAVPERVLSDEERYQRHFAERIRAINDSISGEAERVRRANDWTITDRNGNKWGLNERGIVVGGRNVPTPRPGYGRPQRDREDEARRERDQRAEIDRQADGIERDRHLRERQRAIRERADREREQAGQGSP